MWNFYFVLISNMWSTGLALNWQYMTVQTHLTGFLCNQTCNRMFW